MNGLPKKLKLGKYSIPADLTRIRENIHRAKGILICLYFDSAEIGVFLHGRWDLLAFRGIIRAIRDEIESMSMDDEIASQFRQPYMQYKMEGLD